MFILEGNIGAGKSTLISILKESLPEINCNQEPVESWQKSALGGSLLEEFYKDAKRWSYAMENFTLICRVKEFGKQKPGKTIVERSIFSGFYCFAKNGYLNGSMSKIEWELYNQWFNFFANKNGFCMPSGFIYLKSDPEICFQRVQKRSRSAENSLTLDYLKDVSKMHDKMLLSKEDLLPQLTNVPVLVLNADFEFEDDAAIKNHFVASVRAFVNKNTVVPARKTDWEVAQTEPEVNL